MARRLEGRSVILTGGGRGMGAAEAELFRDEGAQVLIADIDAETGSGVAERLGDDVVFQQLDVGDPEQWDAVAHARANQAAIDGAPLKRAGRVDGLARAALFLARELIHDRRRAGLRRRADAVMPLGQPADRELRTSILTGPSRAA